MLGFLGLNLLHELGSRLVLVPQTFGKFSIYPAIFFLKRNGQSQNFTLAEIFEVFRHKWSQKQEIGSNLSYERCIRDNGSEPKECWIEYPYMARASTILKISA